MSEMETKPGGKPENKVLDDGEREIAGGVHASGVVENDSAQDAENAIETYAAIAEWIRFADAKAAVVLTVSGALASFLIPTFRTFLADQGDTSSWQFGFRFATASIFVGYLATTVCSSILAFKCITPSRKKGRHPALDHCPHFHPAAIAARYAESNTDEFMNNNDRLGTRGLIREIHAAILFDSHISNRKYGFVASSIRWFSVSAALGFLYFFMAQF